MVEQGDLAEVSAWEAMEGQVAHIPVMMLDVVAMAAMAAMAVMAVSEVMVNQEEAWLFPLMEVFH